MQAETAGRCTHNEPQRSRIPSDGQQVAMTYSLPAPSWPHVLQVQCRSAQSRIRQPHLNPYSHNLRALTVYTRLPAVRHLAAKKTVKRGRGTVGCMAPQLQQRCLGPSGPVPGVPQCSTVAPALQAICGLGLRTLPHSRRSRLHGCRGSASARAAQPVLCSWPAAAPNTACRGRLSETGAGQL